MTKQEAITNISSILNRKSALDDETSYFEDKKHDQLLELLLRYVENSKNLIGNPKVFKTQALNDHGVDLIIEYPNSCKLGIQIKSHFDVNEADFALKVKAQLAESQFHGLDKWYLIICCPLKVKSKDYSSKISHLINELSSYKTTYHAIYSPQHALQILCGGIMSEGEFRNIKNQYSYDEINWPEILQDLKSKKSISSYVSNDTPANYPATNANLYLEYLNFGDDERESCLADLEETRLLLEKLSQKTREFLNICLSRGNDRNIGIREYIVVACHDIENFLDISPSVVKKEMAILEDNRIAYVDDLEGNNIFYILINQTNDNYNILKDIKTFCLKKNKNLEDIIVGLDFRNFDR